MFTGGFQHQLLCLFRIAAVGHTNINNDDCAIIGEGKISHHGLHQQSVRYDQEIPFLTEDASAVDADVLDVPDFARGKFDPVSNFERSIQEFGYSSDHVGEDIMVQ